MRSVSRMAFALLLLGLGVSARAQQYDANPASVTVPIPPRAITIDDYFQIRDVAQPELSPDGQWVAYAVRTKMLKEDKIEQRLWMVSTHGGDPLPMTAEGVSSSHPRWSPHGKYLAFLSSRNAGKNELWLLNRLRCEPVPPTETAPSVNDFEWPPD